MQEFDKKGYLDRLRITLEFSALTQTEIASKIGISKQTLTDYKSGKSFPPINVLAKLCLVLDVSSDYLLGIQDYEVN